MSDLEKFESWAALARKKSAPRAEVADAVIRRLRETETSGPPAWMWTFAATAACAAAILVFFGYAAGQNLLGGFCVGIEAML